MLKRLWNVLASKDSPGNLFGVQAIEALLEELVCFSTSEEKRCREYYEQERTDKVLQWLRCDRVIQTGEVLPHTAFKVAACTNALIVAENLMKAHYKFPMVFRRAMEVCKRTIPIADLANGMKALGMQYFPHVDLNKNRNPNINWKGRTVVRLEFPEDNPLSKPKYLLERLTWQVKEMLVERGIIFQGNLSNKLYHVTVFPWMQEVSLLSH